MYSYADRMRAVQLYNKLGKRVGATIRELGYPTKNALKDWYREYERHHDLPAGYVRTKPWYSDEQKRVAVEHYPSHGRCLAETRKVLVDAAVGGMDEGLLRALTVGRPIDGGATECVTQPHGN